MRKSVLYFCWVSAAAAAAIFSSCAGDNLTNSEVTSAADSDYQSSAVASEPAAESEAEYIEISVEAQKYEAEQLTFSYNGQSYTLPLRRDLFKDDIAYHEGQKTYSEQIINNTLGEQVTAKLTISEDMTKIKLCDVIKPNGMKISNSGGVCTMTRKSGSICEFKDDTMTLTADLNDLIDSQKSNYPQIVEDVLYQGFLFKSGNFIINELYIATEGEDGETSYEEFTNRELPSFFGKITQLDEERAEVLLNDGVTVCEIPIYYHDGELSQGQQVMVTLDSELSLFGSGELQSFDYAVIYTSEDILGGAARDFDDLAYAKANPNRLGDFIYTYID